MKKLILNVGSIPAQGLFTCTNKFILITGPRYKIFSCSTRLINKFFLLLKVPVILSVNMKAYCDECFSKTVSSLVYKQYHEKTYSD